jgi:hypothetical protein
MTAQGGATKLEAFRDALKETSSKLQNESYKGSVSILGRSVVLFAYGFGFGGLGAFLSPGPAVRDLLDRRGDGQSIVALEELSSQWEQWEGHFVKLAFAMLGQTPMLAGFMELTERLRLERSKMSLFGPPIILVLSDGDPTDSSPDQVVSAAKTLQDLGCIIISCYVTDSSVTEPRRLYSSAKDQWPSGAKLMLACASKLPSLSPLEGYLAQYGWSIEPEARLFAQINQPEILSEFMGTIASPVLNIQPSFSVPHKDFALTSAPSLTRKEVFITYSHRDAKYLENDSLYGFIRGLEKEGFSFWDDRQLRGGDNWDHEIKKQIARTDIALALVSQSFLNSGYCQNIEIVQLLDKRKNHGLVVFPIILSPCDWKSYGWLAATQFEPRGGKTIENDYRDRGRRDGLFLQILEQLRSMKE